MLRIGRGYRVGLMLVILFLAGFGLGRLLYQPHFQLGDRSIRLDPRARIHPKKTYHLTVWDYDLPLQRQEYQDYLRRAIRRFQESYPNIRVELKLLDLLDGEKQLAQALRTGDLPDVYCSLYQVPSFDYRWQIPVAPFLTQAELRVFDPTLVKMMSVAGLQCYFPRWTAPVVWIGNRSALEKAGIAVDAIQQTGWTWEDLLQAYERKPGGYRFAAIGGDSGFLGQWVMENRRQSGKAAMAAGLELLERLVRARALPLDYASNAVGRFLNGNTLVLAGARPWLYQFLKAKAPAAAAAPRVEPVLLPGPYRRGGAAWLPVENGVVTVYRNRRTRGEDQIAAAVRLGYFLSTYADSRPWQELMVYPAAAEPRRDWERSAGREYPLGPLLSRTALVNQNRPTGESPAAQSLDDYLTGKKSREELLGQLEGELQAGSF
ncbi:ABC-type glycerol-3-phosphate transport system substrate-binding protein [Hydrogenispora ethanolica]|jgi:multiple sugar transport system substrate-binding protein|uniref:ABC-type glycerol-3-phosphate transport system substrate-binding protein n=1 Tax=Hydrogenispora ethanolica TaxID=1082276 RepID=A0A4R1S2H4_HYDET|nr:extracellular solute-binding protein [Hydrogenispora ethanolica]TCL73219.1 ABC-type glycerol-3-phosphate transport system substrate-binding protein [Hydrogenispora ethanolica]